MPENLIFIKNYGIIKKNVFFTDRPLFHRNIYPVPIGAAQKKILFSHPCSLLCLLRARRQLERTFVEKTNTFPCEKKSWQIQFTFNRNICHIAGTDRQVWVLGKSLSIERAAIWRKKSVDLGPTGNTDLGVCPRPFQLKSRPYRGVVAGHLAQKSRWQILGKMEKNGLTKNSQKIFLKRLTFVKFGPWCPLSARRNLGNCLTLFQAKAKNTLSGILGISRRGVPQYSANSHRIIREYQ